MEQTRINTPPHPSVCKHDWEPGHPVTTADGHTIPGWRCLLCGMRGYWAFIPVADPPGRAS
jgi:hypothetical protein